MATRQKRFTSTCSSLPILLMMCGRLVEELRGTTARVGKQPPEGVPFLSPPTGLGRTVGNQNRGGPRYISSSCCLKPSPSCSRLSAQEDRVGKAERPRKREPCSADRVLIPTALCSSTYLGWAPHSASGWCSCSHCSSAGRVELAPCLGGFPVLGVRLCCHHQDNFAAQ